MRARSRWLVAMFGVVLACSDDTESTGSSENTGSSEGSEGSAGTGATTASPTTSTSQDSSNLGSTGSSDSGQESGGTTEAQQGDRFALDFPSNVSGADQEAPFVALQFDDPHLDGRRITGS